MSRHPLRPIPGTPGYELLPCGCELGTVIHPGPGPDAGERVFVHVPCSLDCPYYRYTVDESHRQGKPVRLAVEGES